MWCQFALPCRVRNFVVFSQWNTLVVVITMATDILTIKEVAEFLKLTEKTAYRLAADGKIPGFKVGGSWRFRRDEIEKMTRSEQPNKKNGKS
jgi:excisionase family DNA binding protein